MYSVYQDLREVWCEAVVSCFKSFALHLYWYTERKHELFQAVKLGFQLAVDWIIVCPLGYNVSDRTVLDCDREGGHWRRAVITHGSWSVCVCCCCCKCLYCFDVVEGLWYINLQVAGPPNRLPCYNGVMLLVRLLISLSLSPSSFLLPPSLHHHTHPWSTHAGLLVFCTDCVLWHVVLLFLRYDGVFFSRDL